MTMQQRHHSYRVQGGVEIYGTFSVADSLSDDIDMIVLATNEQHAYTLAHRRICERYNLNPTLDTVIWGENEPTFQRKETK